jgi:N-methylhydantoinase A
LYSDVVSEFSRSLYVETRSLDVDAVNETLAAVEAAADEFLQDLADVEPEAARKEFAVEARYRAQVWELDVPVPSRLDGPASIADLEERFHAVHERVFAVREPGQYLECLLWKARATAVLAKPDVRTQRLLAEAGVDPVGEGPAYFAEMGTVLVPRYAGGRLRTGTAIAGPAIIREPTTTLVVYPGATATVTPLGNYLLDVGGGLEAE